MARKRSRKSLIYGAVSGAAVIGLIFLVLLGTGVIKLSVTGSDDGSATGTFGLSCIDGKRNYAFNLNDVDASMHALPIGEDATDWNAWDTVAGIADLGDISANDLDTSVYSRFVVNYSANNIDVGTATEGDDDQDVDYYWRYAEIYPGQLNTLYLYETPNAGAGFVVVNTETFVTIATNSTYPIYGDCDYAAAGLYGRDLVNVTVMTAINASQRYAAYVAFWNFATNEMADLEWTFTANKTVLAADWLNENGLVKTRPSTTTLAFSANTLDKNGLQHSYKWGASPTADICLNALALTFNKVTI